MAYMNQEKKKELATGIMVVCKKYGFKASISVRHHSTLVVCISIGPIDFLTGHNERTVKRLTEQNRLFDYTPETYIQVNEYHIKSTYTGKALQFLTELLSAMNKGNHNNSDLMTDYFDVGWYTDISIGKYDKPYIFMPDKDVKEELTNLDEPKSLSVGVQVEPSQTLSSEPNNLSQDKQFEPELTLSSDPNFSQTDFSKASKQNLPSCLDLSTSCIDLSICNARIEEHVHTKKGFTMYIVILAEKVEREEYLKLLAKAKSLGGWYSWKYGTIPAGFAFKEESQAELFVGNTPVISDPKNGTDEPSCDSLSTSYKPLSKFL